MLCVVSFAVDSDQWPSVPSMCSHVFRGQVKGTAGAAAAGAGVEGIASAVGTHPHLPPSHSGSSILFTLLDFPVIVGGGWKEQWGWRAGLLLYVPLISELTERGQGGRVSLRNQESLAHLWIV